MSKEALEKFKKPRSGRYIPNGIARELIDQIVEEDVTSEFAYGFATALSFMTCPEDMPMHGKGLHEYIENYKGFMEEEGASAIPPEMLSDARRVIEQLKRHGVGVVDVVLVRKEG